MTSNKTNTSIMTWYSSNNNYYIVEVYDIFSKHIIMMWLRCQHNFSLSPPYCMYTSLYEKLTGKTTLVIISARPFAFSAYATDFNFMVAWMRLKKFNTMMIISMPRCLFSPSQIVGILSEIWIIIFKVKIS